MPDYRRIFIPGATCFFTLVTHQRRPWLCTPATRGALREAVVKVRQSRPFAVEAWVLLPDHLHCIWTLPPGDADYTTRWRLIKRAVSLRLANEPDGTLSDSRRKRRERGLWQRRFSEHAIRDERDFEAHCSHIHYNAVKHGMCLAKLFSGGFRRHFSAASAPFPVFRTHLGCEDPATPSWRSPGRGVRVPYRAAQQVCAGRARGDIVIGCQIYRPG